MFHCSNPLVALLKQQKERYHVFLATLLMWICVQCMQIGLVTQYLVFRMEDCASQDLRLTILIKCMETRRFARTDEVDKWQTVFTSFKVSFKSNIPTLLLS